MALAKKCDICGVLYELYNVVDSAGKAKNIHNGISFVNIDNRGSCFVGRLLDCCPGCMDSIKLHIENLKGGGHDK